jgi:hypothetical protein
MPADRSAWACWNCLTLSDPDPENMRVNKSRVSLTCMFSYFNTASVQHKLILLRSDWMNAIQGIDEEKHGLVFVTSNPPVAPDPSKLIGVYAFDHPQLDGNVRSALSILPSFRYRLLIHFTGYPRPVSPSDDPEHARNNLRWSMGTLRLPRGRLHRRPACCHQVCEPPGGVPTVRNCRSPSGADGCPSRSPSFRTI